MGCYFCGGEITGVEHVPPRSFFPKGKRQNLITVGSCDQHNQEKSREDEYIRAILLASIKLDNQSHIDVLRDTNTRALVRSVERAYEKISTEVQAKEVIDIFDKHKGDPLGAAKAIDEAASQGIMSFGLMGLLNKEVLEETVFDENGEEVKTTSFTYDQNRFDAFFECMARGIFYHELGQRWEGKVNILPLTFLRDDAPQRDKELSREFLQHFDLTNAKGAQSEYFCYDGANMTDPQTGEHTCIFFNFRLFNTFYFTAIFPYDITGK